MKTLSLLIFCVASISFAEDFKTIDGKEYKDVKVTRVEPDGIVVRAKSGISKLYFAELPKDVQARFNYNAQNATAYSAQQTANYAAYQKQQEDAQREQADADAQKRAIFPQQQATNNAAPQQEEAFGQGQPQANQPRPRHTPKYTTVLHQLPVPRSQPSPPTQPKQPKKSKEHASSH